MIRRLSVALLLVAAVSSCGRYLSSSVAVVDGVRLSMDDFDRRVESLRFDPQFASQLQAGGQQRLEFHRQVVAEMIQDQLVLEEAERRHVLPATPAVDRRIADLRGQFGSEAEFNAAMRREGLNLAELRRRVFQRLALEAVRDDLAGGPVSDARLRAFYDANRSQFARVRVSHILFQARTPDQLPAALARARAALARIRAGVNFAALARQLSDDTGSKSTGGDLGVIDRNQAVPEFEQAAFSLPVGRVSEPIKTQFGYHLILVTQKLTKPFSEVVEDIRTQLGQPAELGFNQWLALRLRTATIEVNPRFGDWNPRRSAIQPHRFFVPPSPSAESSP